MDTGCPTIIPYTISYSMIINNKKEDKDSRDLYPLFSHLAIYRLSNQVSEYLPASFYASNTVLIGQKRRNLHIGR